MSAIAVLILLVLHGCQQQESAVLVGSTLLVKNCGMCKNCVVSQFSGINHMRVSCLCSGHVLEL